VRWAYRFGEIGGEKPAAAAAEPARVGEPGAAARYGDILEDGVEALGGTTAFPARRSSIQPWTRPAVSGRLSHLQNSSSILALAGPDSADSDAPSGMECSGCSTLMDKSAMTGQGGRESAL